MYMFYSSHRSLTRTAVKQEMRKEIEENQKVRYYKRRIHLIVQDVVFDESLIVLISVNIFLFCM